MSSNWMFGGGGGEEQQFGRDEPNSKKTYFNREWEKNDTSGLQIGINTGSKDEVFSQKRREQQRIRDGLDADRLAKDELARQENGGSSPGVELDWQGRPPAQQQQQRIPSIPSKYSVASMIAHESAPENSPRYRNRQELDREEEVPDEAEKEQVAAFGIGEADEVLKRRQKAQREQYRQALDRDTGSTRETVPRPPERATPITVSNGITGLQVGQGAPRLDMSPSMKSLALEIKRRSQASYRLQLVEQSAPRLSKAERLFEAVSERSTQQPKPLPYMR